MSFPLVDLGRARENLRSSLHTLDRFYSLSSLRRIGLSLFLLAVIPASGVMAAEQSISGHVIGVDGTPVAAAMISLVSGQGEPLRIAPAALPPDTKAISIKRC